MASDVSPTPHDEPSCDGNVEGYNTREDTPSSKDTTVDPTEQEEDGDGVGGGGDSVEAGASRVEVGE